MRSRVFSTLFTVGTLVAITACSVTTTTTDPGGTGPTGSSETPAEPSDPELAGIVAAHNEVRAGVSPAPASPLGKLAWSEEDAAVARAYAEKCVFSHNKDRGTRGENLYASSGSSSAAEVVKSWASEVSDYDYATNKCSGVCGHYTQVVWGATTHLGCAKKTCTTNSPFGGKGSWEIWVCNYSPPGNFVGKKPY
ncbi:MAG: CAP domain-containing protein [Polyangiaceae bacterium]